MSQAFDTDSRTHLPYPPSFCPTVEALESEIVIVWSELCAAVRRDGPLVHTLLIWKLHDLGVLRFQAQQRQGGAA